MKVIPVVLDFATATWYQEPAVIAGFEVTRSPSMTPNWVSSSSPPPSMPKLQPPNPKEASPDDALAVGRNRRARA
jgi:hypothetical protein